MKKIKAIAIILSLSVLGLGLTACEKSHKAVKYSESTYPINTFAIDEASVSVKYENNFYETSDDDYYIPDDDYEVPDPSSNVEITEHDGGEIILQNEDTTTDYEIDGDNVIYKEHTYVNLASIVESINTPCDKNTFINFIVKTANKDTTVSLSLITDQYVGTDTSPFDICLASEAYKSIKEKYGTDVEWYISIEGGKGIYGNGQFMFTVDTKEDIIIDMSEYDSTPSHSEEEQEQNTEEQNTEEQSEDN